MKLKKATIAKLSELFEEEESKINQTLLEQDLPEIRQQYVNLYKHSIEQILAETDFNLLAMKAAIFGLWKASQQYDPRRLYHFMNYAIHWIERSIELRHQLDLEKVSTVYTQTFDNAYAH